MGIFDDYVGDIRRELKRTSSEIEKLKLNKQKVIDTINNAEIKINHLSDEEVLKEKLVQKIQATKKIIKD